MTDFERRSIISGIGQSAIGRKLMRTDLDITLDAARAAIADAGLNVDDIDGIAAYPARWVAARAVLPGPEPPRCRTRCG